VVEHRAPESADFPLQLLLLPGTRRLDHPDGTVANDFRISGKRIRRGKPGRNEREKKKKEEERSARPRPPGSPWNPSSHKLLC
jgi:hypothetical protein